MDSYKQLVRSILPLHSLQSRLIAHKELQIALLSLEHNFINDLQGVIYHLKLDLEQRLIYIYVLNDASRAQTHLPIDALTIVANSADDVRDGEVLLRSSDLVL